MSQQDTGQTGKPVAAQHLDRILTPFREFIHTESGSGIVLLLTTIVALAWANSAWGDSYFDLWHTEFALDFGGEFVLSQSLHYWINDGLMVIFFLVVGLEIKREVLVGELSVVRQAVLPIVAALGGAIVPAAIFVFLNLGTPAQDGWGIPMATDIAFALGILALLGSRVPVSLKVFLTALAIIDDILAVLVIAFFYTADLSFSYLLVGAGFLAILVAANWLRIRRPMVYGIIGLGLWYAFLQSGVHATVAGVLLAMTIPSRTRLDSEEFVRRGQASLDEFRNTGDLDASVLTNREHQAALQDLKNTTELAESPMQRLEHALHPWASFVIIPIFAFANAGVLVGEQLSTALTGPLGLGIILGLVVGKQIGITLFAWASVKLGLSRLPPGIGFRHIYGIGWLAGIGFTMSLFITELGFADEELQATAKMGVLTASLISGVVGWLLLRWLLDPPAEATERSAEHEVQHAETAASPSESMHNH